MGLCKKNISQPEGSCGSIATSGTGTAHAMNTTTPERSNTMEKNFINFNPERVLIRLAAIMADQQGIKSPKVTLTKLTYKGKAVKQA